MAITLAVDIMCKLFNSTACPGVPGIPSIICVLVSSTVIIIYHEVTHFVFIILESVVLKWQGERKEKERNKQIATP